jgi:hypothetical protein
VLFNTGGALKYLDVIARPAEPGRQTLR